jgi:hypothetical protein
MTDLAPFNLPGRFWRGNIHTHSTLSDGALPPEKVIQAYKAAGYDFLQLSEHFISHYDWPVADTRQFRSNSFTTLIGAELHAPKTAVGELWHIVAAGLPLDFEPCAENESGADIARRAASCGAFISIAHPAWSQLTLADGLSVDVAHSVEIYNTGCDIENDRGDGSYLLDQLLNQGRHLSLNATDDAHFRQGEMDAFGGWVHVKAQNLEPEEILASLKAGHFYSSQGPQIYEMSLTGTALTIVCSPVDAISLIGGTSRTVTRLGRAFTTATLELSDLDNGWLAAEPSPWLRLVIRDETGKKAWTNPIWLNEL